jgi:hypothetical protein
MVMPPVPDSSQLFQKIFTGNRVAKQAMGDAPVQATVVSATANQVVVTIDGFDRTNQATFTANYEPHPGGGTPPRGTPCLLAFPPNNRNRTPWVIGFSGWPTASGGGTVDSVVAGTNVSVDDTDPHNPIVSALGGGPGPVAVVSAFNTEVTSSPPSGAATIDGYSVSTGDRAFLAVQVNSVDRGIWIANTGGAWTRPPDWATGTVIPDGTLISVAFELGDNLYGTVWILEGDCTVGTTGPGFQALAGSPAFDVVPVSGGVPKTHVWRLTVGTNAPAILSSPASPVGSLSALAKGDICIDIGTPAIWQASAAGTGGWVMI